MARDYFDFLVVQSPTNHYKPFNAIIIKLLPENDKDKKVTALPQNKNH